MGSIQNTSAKACVVVRAGEGAEGRTGVTYAAGISSASAGARGLCLQLASLPPGAQSRAHLHQDHESAAYVIEGTMVMRFGERLEHGVSAGPGDFIYIPDGVPHVVLNPSETEAAVAVLARTDPEAQESVTELPELDALAQGPPET
jgi:uncharacterized RmlC-like cupin family protein